MDTTPHQLFLLADHIKLSLLERQRTQTHGPQARKQDARLTRSLETLRSGLETLRQRQADQDAAGENTDDLSDQIPRLQTQYDSLNGQHANIKTTEPHAEHKKTASPGPKVVRFKDDPQSAIGPDDAFDSDHEPSRAALFARSGQQYHDDPTQDSYTDDPEQSNVQIYEQQTQTMRDQDEQLGHLASSVGRQRELSIQMGHEFAEQAVMLDDIESGVDRHIGSLARARTRLDGVSRRAKQNWSWLTIAILIIVLILLIALLKI